jgi:hypothetical protein
MTTSNKLWLATLGCTAWLGACGTETPMETPPPPPPTAMPDPVALDTFVSGLAWEEPAPPSETEMPNGEPYLASALDHEGTEKFFDCQDVDYDVTANYDKVLWLAGAQTAVKPGIILQGKAFAEGNLQAVPLRRSPITLSIDLGVTNATRIVEEPSTATIQQAISELQAEADELPDLPSTLSFTSEEVYTDKQLSYSLGVHASYDGLIASGGFDSTFSMQNGLTSHTISARLIQPMYTISFADDQLARPSDFFAADILPEEWQAQRDLGTIDDDNAPVFISSVTYGRMVMFTIESQEGETAQQLEVAVRASTATFSGSAELDAASAETLRTSRRNVLAVGGSNNNAGEALATGDLSKFFIKANATSAVPISFVVRTMTGTRKIALLGDTTMYTASRCAPLSTGRWMPISPVGEVYDTLSAGGAGMVVATRGNQIYRMNAAGGFDHVPSSRSVRQASIGIDGTIGYVSTDDYVQQIAANLSSEFNYGGAAGRWIDVYNATTNSILGTNCEIYNYFPGFTQYEGWGGCATMTAMDANNRYWHPSTNGNAYERVRATGWIVVDEGGLPGRLDYISVGAPDQVYGVSNGSNFKLKFPERTWEPISGNISMRVIEVGFDGSVWGIGGDGRIHKRVGPAE